MHAVSVVIPTYNHAQLLRFALDSVLKQTWGAWEALVVNNFSQDNTAEIVNGYKDPRIRLINFNNHGIIAASRNVGISHASGEWVAFLDSDDLWYPRKLERTLTALAGGEDVACHAERWIRADSTGKTVRYGPAERANYKSLLFGHNCLSTSATVVRTSSLREVNGFREDPEFVGVEDYDLWLRLASRGKRFVFIEEVLGQYRIHESNFSGNMKKQLRSELAVLNSHFAELGPLSSMDRMRRAIRIWRAYAGFAKRWAEAVSPICRAATGRE